MGEHHGRIAILTPTRARPVAVLRRCIQSVDRQSVPYWSHVICSDGGREPQVEQMIAAGNDPRRSYAFTPEQRGHFGAGVRAELVHAVATEYVAFLDDDNLLFPRFVERMVAALDRAPEAGFAVCQIVHNGPVPERFGPPPVLLDGIPPVVGNIDTLQVVARSAAIRRGGWVLDGYLSDGATYDRLSRSVPWVVVDEVLGMHA